MNHKGDARLATRNPQAETTFLDVACHMGQAGCRTAPEVSNRGLDTLIRPIDSAEKFKLRHSPVLSN